MKIFILFALLSFITSEEIKLSSTQFSNPSIATLTSGKFVIVWEKDGVDLSAFGIAVQMFNADGSLYGEEFTANTYTTGDQV